MQSLGPSGQVLREVVQIVQGNQKFHADFGGTREQVFWMARMLRIALANHDAEQAKRSGKVA